MYKELKFNDLTVVVNYCNEYPEGGTFDCNVGTIRKVDVVFDDQLGDQRTIGRIVYGPDQGVTYDPSHDTVEFGNFSVGCYVLNYEHVLHCSIVEIYETPKAYTIRL
jgi:hypothetical protein